MNYYTDLLPFELKDELLNYFYADELVELCHIAHELFKKCFDQNFWKKRLDEDFNWLVKANVDAYLRGASNMKPYTARDVYVLGSFIYVNESGHDYIYMGDVMNYLNKNMTDNPSYLEREVISVYMNKYAERNALISKIDNTNLAVYLYENYPQYKLAILMAILLLSDAKIQNEFSTRISDLPSFPYDALVKIFQKIGMEDLVPKIRRTFNANKLIESTNEDIEMSDEI